MRRRDYHAGSRVTQRPNAVHHAARIREVFDDVSSHDDVVLWVQPQLMQRLGVTINHVIENAVVPTIIDCILTIVHPRRLGTVRESLMERFLGKSDAFRSLQADKTNATDVQHAASAA